MQMETEGEYDISITFDGGLMVAVDTNLQEFDQAEIEAVIYEKIENLIVDLRKEFLKQLKDEYEYQTSEEAIVETLEANEYLFTKEGKAI
jgi:hypothetical protein